MSTITTIDGSSAIKKIDDNKEAKVLLLTTRMNNKTIKVFRTVEEEGDGLSLSTEVEDIEMQRRKSFKLHRDDGTFLNIEIAFSELQDDYAAYIVDDLWHSSYLKPRKVARSLIEKIEASLLQLHPSYATLKKVVADKQGKEVVELLLLSAYTSYELEIKSQASYLEDFLQDGITLGAFTKALKNEVLKHEGNNNIVAIDAAEEYLSSLPKAKGEKA